MDGESLRARMGDAKRPTINGLRERLGLPIAPPPRNTTEPCRTCADTRGALETADGRMAVFCFIPKDRARLYPMLRAVVIPEESVMPCWRPR